MTQKSDNVINLTVLGIISDYQYNPVTGSPILDKSGNPVPVPNGGGCNISQSAITSMIATNIASAITSLVASTQAFQSAISSSSTTTTQSNVGLSLESIIIIIVIVVIVGGIAFFYFTMGKGSPIWYYDVKSDDKIWNYSNYCCSDCTSCLLFL